MDIYIWIEKDGYGGESIGGVFSNLEDAVKVANGFGFRIEHWSNSSNGEKYPVFVHAYAVNGDL